MEPIPETVEAVQEFGPFTADDDLLDQLRRSAERVRAVVPSCMGITLAFVREGLAFTLVATDTEIAALDAMQYLSDGPCLAAVRERETVTYDADDPADERRWELFARTTATYGVACTLTLPILGDDEAGDDGVVVGSVNLYAAAPDAFVGHHDAVADVFGAWAGGAVLNADLDFETRHAAMAAPEVLRGQIDVSRAIGALATAQDIDAEAAYDLVHAAALRAGVDLTTIARIILASWDGGEL